MDENTKKKILEITEARDVSSIELIQSLWSNYGELLRIHLKDGKYKSVILKHIQLPKDISHPRGFNTNLSHQRKIQSYKVETNWYEHFNDAKSLTAKKLLSFQTEDEFFILLEDLDSLGFNKRISAASFAEVQVVISWLACFHATYLNTNPEGLWQSGTYWHLETRPDELDILKKEDRKLYQAAWFIDQKLKNAKYQTLIHGDAKLANFCFSNSLKEVAAVDFQYVGGGCGMKDVAYFIGSCLSEKESERNEKEILDFYFSELKKNITNTETKKEIEEDWRPLYHVAWADFHRFLKGWSPGHWKINSYSEKVSNSVQEEVFNNLVETAKVACLEAGKILMEKWKTEIKVSSKEGSSPSTQIVTEVDLLSQEKILEIIKPSLQNYDFGLLAEENNDDKSRLEKEYFWCVDPLDGTLSFSEGKSGFAVAISLIHKSGETVLGAVYDPVEDNFYHAIKDRGCFVNGEGFETNKKKNKDKTQVFADRSLKNATNYSQLEEEFDIQYSGGAVMNVINTLLSSGATYFKYPKKEIGGCAIWDLAGTSLLLKEAGGVFTKLNGKELSFNNPSTLYFNEDGFIACNNNEIYKEVKSKL